VVHCAQLELLALMMIPMTDSAKTRTRGRDMGRLYRTRASVSTRRSSYARSMTRAALLIVLLLACKGSDGKTSPPARDCDDVLHAAVGRTMASKSGTSQPARAKMIASIETTLIARCRDDQWSQAVLECMATAGDNAASRACERKHLTVEQHAKVHAALDALAEPRDREMVGEILARMTDFKDRLCACTDATCADTVMDELEVYGKETSGGVASKAPKKMNAEEMGRSKAIMDEIVACRVRIETPSTTP